MKKSFIFLIFCIYFFSILGETKAENYKNISPVVQIISYYDIYGKYPMMMGWGSASIISKDGIIISNDHVVDSGNGSLASAFSICITKQNGKKPSCDYTASLINRDDKLDISILKIDPFDIYGNTVNYSEFKTIDIDYDYIAKNRDDTIAIGYPWIGADTISETKGIISGISEYNGYKYLKTDTLIAGGNSGGAFVKDGKLIGIPTFGIGWGDSMGYALDIKEAKDFIEENKVKASIKNPITEIIDFNFYRKTLENINSNLKIKDDIFDVTLLPDYGVSNYKKNNSINIELQKQKDTGVNYLSLKVEKVPDLSTDKRLYYYLEKIGFYNKDRQKLIKKEINGITFFVSIDKNDLSNGESSWGNSYKAIVGGGQYMLSIDLSAPFYDEKRNKEVKIEVEKVLSGIKFNLENLSKINADFDINIPEVSIKNFKKTIADTGLYNLYFSDNLYESLNIGVGELREYNGKGESLDKIYDVELKDIDISKKAKIKFKGLEGYIYCSDNMYYNYYYSYNYYMNNTGIDENGNPIDLKTCNIKIFFPKNEQLNRQNFLNIDIVSKKNNLSKNIDITKIFLERNLNIFSENNLVDIPNIIKNQVSINFKDLSNQTESYKNMLSLLVRYNLLKNTDTFDGDKALKWGEYIEMYLKNIYNAKINENCTNNTDYKCKFNSVEMAGENRNLNTIFSDLGIDYNEYVMSSNIYNFGLYLEYKLVGVDFGEFSEENIVNFQNLINEGKYIKEKEKIDIFRNKIYGKRKIGINEFYGDINTFYNTNTEARYYIKNDRIVYFPLYKKGKFSFSYKEDSSIKYTLEASNILKKYICEDKKNYNEYATCNKERDNELTKLKDKYSDIYIESADRDYTKAYYLVYTKAQAISDMIYNMDFGLFDKELAKKKEVIIE